MHALLSAAAGGLESMEVFTWDLATHQALLPPEILQRLCRLSDLCLYVSNDWGSEGRCRPQSAQALLEARCSCQPLCDHSHRCPCNGAPPPLQSGQ